MANPLVTGNNGSDFNESTVNWQRRGHEQAMAMLNGLTPEYANADADGDPTGGCLDGDYTDLQRANAWDKIDDEYFEAEIDQAARRAAGHDPT